MKDTSIYKAYLLVTVAMFDAQFGLGGAVMALMTGYIKI